ncbi:ubiquitin activating enzyme, putative [Plasmodium ovale curtisi]|uniref:Ubiquitin activating enzyme, putative n=1 Tax=Plasmodium ovale curtisi TaxID=864141 RepID=A0A1A8W4E5_PLAOA|nr:ubiquitin activating enzyme, putative [Plasmodium ovale curtisi]
MFAKEELGVNQSVPSGQEKKGNRRLNMSTWTKCSYSNIPIIGWVVEKIEVLRLCPPFLPAFLFTLPKRSQLASRKIRYVTDRIGTNYPSPSTNIYTKRNLQRENNGIQREKRNAQIVHKLYNLQVENKNKVKGKTYFSLYKHFNEDIKNKKNSNNLQSGKVLTDILKSRSFKNCTQCKIHILDSEKGEGNKKGCTSDVFKDVERKEEAAKVETDPPREDNKNRREVVKKVQPLERCKNGKRSEIHEEVTLGETHKLSAADILEGAKKYSRQMYTHGYGEEAKIRKSKILIVGLNGTSSEICKNLIICGVKEVGLYDNNILSYEDIDNLFFCDKKLVNKEKKSISCLENMQKLSDNCKINIITSNINSCVNDYDVVVSVNQRELFNVHLNNVCRDKRKKFICVNTVGLFGRVFLDFGQFTFSSGMSNDVYKIGVIEFHGNNLIVHCLPYYENIQLNEGDVVTLEIRTADRIINEKCTIRDMCRRNGKLTLSVEKGGKEAKPWKFLNIVLSLKIVKHLKKKFSYRKDHIFHNLRDMVRKKKINYASVKKTYMPVRLDYICLEKYLREVKKKVDTRNSIWHAPLHALRYVLNLLFPGGGKLQLSDEEVCFLCYDEIMAKKEKGENFADNDVLNFKTLCKKKKKNINDQVINQFSSAAHIELSPFSSFFGSLVTQQILKGVTHKFKPIHQTFYYDKRDIFPFSKISRKYYGKYMHQLNFFGEEFQNFLNNLNILLIGSGALGCEFLKLLALVGVSCSVGVSSPVGEKIDNVEKGYTREGEEKQRRQGRGLVQVVDYDMIEESNLSRQFLFTAKDIGKLKCEVAAYNIKKINEDINCAYIKMKVDESVLDNADFLLKKFFYEEGENNSGIEGLKGSSQVVVPFSSESYASGGENQGKDNSNDEEGSNSCTVTSFPKNHKHIIQFSKSVYINYFFENVLKINNFLNDPVRFIGHLCSYDNVTKLIHFFKITKIFFKHNLHMNVHIFWNNIFVNNIIHLLSKNKDEMENYYKDLGKVPQPVYFNKNDKNHILFYQCAIKNFEEVFKNLTKIKSKMIDHIFFFKDVETKERKQNMTIQTALTTLVERNNITLDLKKLFYFLTVIRKNTDSKFYATVEDELYILFNNPVFLMSLKYVQGQNKKRTNKSGEQTQRRKEDFPFFTPLIYNLQNSKDDINFIFSMTNIRNENYNFSKLSILEFFKISNNIIPSIVTVVSMISSLAIFELYKLAYFLKLSKERQKVYQTGDNISKGEQLGDTTSRRENLHRDNPPKEDNFEDTIWIKKQEKKKIYFLKKHFFNTQNASHHGEKVKDLHICMYKDRIYVRKGDKTLFYLFDMKYDQLKNISKWLSNQYINLEDNFFTRSELSKVHVASFENAKIPLLKNVIWSFWNFLYIDIFHKSANTNMGSFPQGQHIFPSRLSGFPMYIFDNHIDVLPEVERENIRRCLEKINEQMDTIKKRSCKTDESRICHGRRSEAIPLTPNENSNLALVESADITLQAVDALLALLEKEEFGSFMAKVASGRDFLRMVRKNVHAVKMQYNSGKESMGSVESNGNVESSVEKSAEEEIRENLLYVQKTIEDLKRDVLFFFSVNNMTEKKSDITLDELVSSIEMLFNVTILTVGVMDKIIYANFEIPSLRHSGSRCLYDILSELFRDHPEKKTFILNIIAIDNSTNKEVVLPDVQINVHRRA